ncbi:MAG TPA: DUF4783 domain-containing protein, partial [Chitinophagaceae bacterium]|nr:DUF4783 domain-containing protein [Chitinophagaceae bacterium]
TLQMKNLKGFALLAITLILVSFKPSYSIDEVVSAIRTGNSAELSKYFDNRVDIALPDKSDTYSKAQAEMIVRDFFSNKGVTGFEVKHKGENGGAQFCVGVLKTRNAEYRTHLFMRQRGDRQLLQEIRFLPAQ